MVTLNNLITDLTSIGNNHDQVETVTNGTLAEFSLNKDDRFPVLHFSPGVTTASGKEIIYSVDILVADIAQDNGDDRDEILSDTNQILLDVIREFRLPATTISRYKYTINDDIALEPFIDDNVDRCTGWLATLEIKVPFDDCASDSPFGVIAPDSCANASVTNSDGSYSVSVSSGGTLNLPDITVTDSDGSTFTQPSVVNVVCSLLADGTVNVNNVFFDNVTSGGTLNIEVRQSSGSTLIGSKQGQYFRIPDSVITLDNTDGTTLSTTDVLATDSLTLTAPDATAVIKNTLNAVLRSELIASNVSEDIIIGDATININQSDGTLISSVTVTAEGAGVYNVADSTVNVLNSLGTVLSSSSVKATDTINVSAPDANIENSDASYVNTIPSNGTLVLPDITVTDSDGTTSSFPSVKNVVCTAAADANVENSNGTYTDTVTSGGTLILPDITVTDSDGSTFTQPSVVNVVCTPGAPTPTLITIYNRPIITFSSTSFATGDTAWQVSQGLFDGWQDSASTSKFWRLQQLDSGAANPSKTLLYNNPFGNKDRYTDHLGTQVYASGVWIDNLTGIMYPTDVGQFNSDNWANTLIAVEAYTDALGNADYHVPPSQLIISLYVYSDTGNPYDDWNGIITGESSARRYWCADTRNASTTNKFYTQLASTGQILTVSETNTTTSCLPYRILTQPT